MKSVESYKGSLPYASELFGIYQPLLGWKSRIIAHRNERIRSTLYSELAARALIAARASVKVELRDTRPDVVTSPLGRLAFEVSELAPADLERGVEPHVATAIDSGIARLLLRGLKAKPPKDWSRVITEERVRELLKQVQGILSDPDELQKDQDLSDYVAAFSKGYEPGDSQSLVENLFAKESKVGGYLLFLAQHTPSTLNALFFQSPTTLLAAAQVADPLLNFGATEYDAILSPIGVIHLYREYFFELDSFLGPPVGHLWLSPGGTVELIEVSTRTTLTERSFEQSLETTTKSETQVTTQDDIADAVKEENRDNIRFGFTATGSYSAAVYSASATADLSLDSTTATSREATHKRMREQSEKLSSEIKRNFKTTFKTSTEVTDTSSKRYVIANTTDKLVNYELRRKMRKVEVQVQDVQVALCWHTFVDDPARDLGVAKLVHIGEPPELGDLVQPDAPQIPSAQAQNVSIAIPFVGINTDDTTNAYTNGVETETGWADFEERIEADFDQQVTFNTPGFTLTAVDVAAQGADALLSVPVESLKSAEGSSAGTFTVHLDYVNWNGQNQIPTNVTLHWAPSEGVRAAVTAEYESRMAEYSIEKARRYKEAFYAAARERIKVASEITPRPSEDLREEERTVVYRALITQLMSVGTHQSKHVISELVRSIFDVDKMLYFVAPEWWAPRLHRSSQHLGEDPGPKPPWPGGRVNLDISDMRMARTAAELAERPSDVVSPAGSTSRGNAITSENIVDWGGAKELGRDNYYITEESFPAKLGASLGWLLQLDGDNLRNAFLNSPWVKAVIPIRVGKERQALNWLEQAHVEGSDGLDEGYIASPGDPAELVSTPGNTVTIRDALDFLIGKIHEFDVSTRTPIMGNPADPESASNHFAGSLPTEAVFEHGFYPLKGGVRFDQDGTEQAIFSQWMEILPTDQVAALEVEYDPKTLQIKDLPE
jgi:hypothetical protein